MLNKFAAFFVGIVVTALAIVASGNAKALTSQAASNITVRPFLQNLSISPGDNIKQFDLTLTNNSNFKQIFSLSPVNFGSLNETGGLVFEGSNVKNISQKYGLIKWLSLDRNNIALDPKQQAIIKVTIHNENDLAPGAHYAAIITTASRPVSIDGQLTVTPKVSSLVFATKLGGEFYDIHLASFKHNGNLWREASTVTVGLKSTGNTYITPRGVVSVKQKNKAVARGIINSQSALVLPETTRTFDVPITKLSGFKTGFLFTRYSIQVDYRYDGNPNFATRSYNELLISKAHVIILGLLVAAVGTLLSYLLKRHSRSDKKK